MPHRIKSLPSKASLPSPSSSAPSAGFPSNSAQDDGRDRLPVKRKTQLKDDFRLAYESFWSIQALQRGVQDDLVLKRRRLFRTDLERNVSSLRFGFLCSLIFAFLWASPSAVRKHNVNRFPPPWAKQRACVTRRGAGPVGVLWRTVPTWLS